MKNIAALVIAILFINFCDAQQFIASGKIEFERRVNLHKLNDYEGWYGDYIRKNAPQFITSYFELLFNGNESLYRPGREVNDPAATNWKNFPGSENTIYTNYQKDSTKASKQVFEQLYLIQDSLPQMQWKLTSETRKIAGFNCRRAETIIMDSVYIVAFYTEEILASGGPESFNGLPGMILGVAIPRLHITLFATKLELAEIRQSDIRQPTKGKKTSFADMNKTLKKSMEDWGKEGARNVWLLGI